MSETRVPFRACARARSSSRSLPIATAAASIASTHLYNRSNSVEKAGDAVSADWTVPSGGRETTRVASAFAASSCSSSSAIRLSFSAASRFSPTFSLIEFVKRFKIGCKSRPLDEDARGARTTGSSAPGSGGTLNSSLMAYESYASCVSQSSATGASVRAWRGGA